MALRWVPWLTIFMLFEGSALGFADSSIHFEESYAGAHPQEFRDVLGQAESILPAALAYITGQWGLPNTLRSPLVVIVSDNASTLPGRPVAAFVRSVRYGDQLSQTLLVDLQHHLMYRDENLNDVLYHEMAHVILQDAVTSEVSAGIPQWFNEGLAQSVTSEGRARTQEDFKRYGHTDGHAVLCDLNGSVDAFYHGEYNFGCYTQYYLAVTRLTQLGGHDAVAKLLAALHNGITLPTILQQVTGLDWTAFQRAVTEFTQNVFSGKEPIP